MDLLASPSSCCRDQTHSLTQSFLTFLTYQIVAFQTACYLVNLFLPPILQYTSPFESLFHQSLNYTKLCTFGCLYYPCLRPYSIYKLKPRSRPCIFLGYSTSLCAYHDLYRSTSKIFPSHLVQFVKHIFPYLSISHSLSLFSTLGMLVVFLLLFLNPST